MGARRQQPESVLQVQVAQFLDAALEPPAFWWHTPNGGRRNPREAARLRAQGVKAGIPDCVIAWGNYGHPNGLNDHPVPQILTIELKAGRNSESLDQLRMQEKFRAIGARTTTCKSLEEVEAACNQAGVPLRGGIWA